MCVRHKFYDRVIGITSIYNGSEDNIRCIQLQPAKLSLIKKKTFVEVLESVFICANVVGFLTWNLNGENTIEELDYKVIQVNNSLYDQRDEQHFSLSHDFVGF